jgi:ABC-type nitrate/sulfonate/bicarbonate transport system permease component
VRRLGSAAAEVTLPLLVLAGWGAWSSRADSFFFPPLLDILRTFRETWLFARLGSDVLPSLERMALGYGLAVAAGVGAGVLVSSSAVVRGLADPILEFLRALPSPMLIPIAILVLGIGPAMKVLVIAAGCVWPVLLNTVDGVRGLDPVASETCAAYGLRPADRLRLVLLPAAGPRIAAGLRTALSLALILMVISEMQASTDGIGFFVIRSQREFAIPEMWSGILLLGLLGYGLNAAFGLAERAALGWHRALVRVPA